MKRTTLLSVFLLVTLSFIAPAVLAKEKPVIYYFYGQGCPHCAQVEEFFEENRIFERYPVEKREVYFNRENAALLDELYDKYKVPTNQRGVPVVFIGNDYLVGSRDIPGRFEELASNFVSSQPVFSPVPIEGKISWDITWPVVILAALVDSINPCAFSVLIFLLVYLLALKAGKRILKVGLTYIGAVFLVYFLGGLGILRVIGFSGLTRLVSRLAATAAVLVGILNIKDFFWYGKGPTLAIPGSKKPLIESYVRKGSVPAAAILGVLVSAFELPCTGGVYLAILALLASITTRRMAVSYLFVYNLIFVLPLFIISWLVYKGLAPERIEKWRREKRRLLRLTMGVVMVGLGVFLFWWGG